MYGWSVVPVMLHYDVDPCVLFFCVRLALRMNEKSAEVECHGTHGARDGLDTCDCARLVHHSRVPMLAPLIQECGILDFFRSVFWQLCVSR